MPYIILFHVFSVKKSTCFAFYVLNQVDFNFFAYQGNLKTCGWCLLSLWNLISHFIFSVRFLCIYFINYRPGVRNAIQIAALLAKEQMMGPSLLGRIPPM